MSSHKNSKTNVRKLPDGGTGYASLTVKVETEASYVELEPHMLAGQVFYIFDRDLSEILKENKTAIWGNLLKKKGSDISRGENIREILKAPDHVRKYPAALICTADKTSRIYSPINISYGRAIDVLQVQAVRFFVIDSDGKAAVEGLESGPCYVCGIGKTKKKSGVWNVQVDLKPGKNNLRLDNQNMTGRRI